MSPWPWERQPRESSAAFAAFCRYRDLNPSERSIDAAYREHHPGSKGAPGRWNHWARLWSWVARTSAYDAHLESLVLAERERLTLEQDSLWTERQAQWREEAWAVAQALLAKIEGMLSFPLETVTLPTVNPVTGEPTPMIVHPARWTFRDMAILAKQADHLARLATGLGTERMALLGDEDHPIEFTIHVGNQHGPPAPDAGLTDEEFERDIL